MAQVAFLDTVHEVLWERLSAAGMECVHSEHVTREEVLAGALSACTGIVLRSRLTVDGELLDALPALQWVARSGAGLDNIDIAEAERRSVRVISSPEGNATAVGEHAVGQLSPCCTNSRVRTGTSVAAAGTARATEAWNWKPEPWASSDSATWAARLLVAFVDSVAGYWHTTSTRQDLPANAVWKNAPLKPSGKGRMWSPCTFR